MLDGGGLQPGGVYLCAGAEKSGKTSLALDMGYHGAVVEGCTVPIVTAEMAKANLAKRLYSAHSGIPYFKFRPGLYDSETDKVYTRAVEGLDDFAKYPIIIADKLYGVGEISRHLRRVCEKAQKIGKPVKFAIIDYLQLLIWDMGKASSTYERVSAISRQLKILAMELGIALIVMSSLNREGLGEGQVPDAKNLRDSGTLAFDCEALLILWNPAYVPGKLYEPKPITDMLLIVSRQRNGPSGNIPVKFIGQYMQFMTLSQYTKAFKTDEIQSRGQQIADEQELDTLWDHMEGTKSKTDGESS
jgi:replicative DNA helicase